ncbi:efflux transporter periplasmic adaptor subunit [Aliidiomarina sedimenti]|uniref:Efflux transporter periplasmic adaptor subunit n=1 Tax=Aliidiomarina sedimenti TaxID=1933879 RepID=A0ABY0BXM0_9GAMM|nr:efflux RND transporter periplasmic adaptor subunit [Aliidiomarina sedimenti]RUO29210.1 efflux transporter periplasmic adaptor subunit [Aliidiomarina sedimenti]
MTLNYLIKLAGGVLLCTLSACSDSNAAPQPDPVNLPRVLVIEVDTEDLRLDRTFPGNTQGSMVTEVRSRVEGLLESRDFEEGQLVQQDQLMFSVEKAPYEVELQRARSDLASAEATFNAAQRDWQRVENLFSDGAISGRERDQAQSAFELGEAELTAAQASVRDAELRFNYTDVRAPIEGVAGRERVSPGNVISEGEVLATITRLDPLYVNFSVAENDIAARYLLANTSVDGSIEDKPSARLVLQDGTTHPLEGHIDYVSRVVTSSTGSLEVRAVIPNPEMDLLPGQFVRVQLPRIDIADAIAVPQRAVIQSGSRSVVYIVDANDSIQVREVILGVRVGSRHLIEQGLAAGDRVVVEGLSMLRPGARVQADKVDAE